MLPPFTAFNSSQIHMCFYGYIDQESYKRPLSLTNVGMKSRIL